MEEITANAPYIYFDNKIYNNFFITDDPSEKKEKEVLLEEFFITFGIFQPMDEVIRFWNYHAQTEWRNVKGQRIANKKAAAQFWRIDEQCLRQSELARKIITRIYPVIPSEQNLCFIDELMNIIQEQNNVTFICKSVRLMDMIENNPKVINALSHILKGICGNDVHLMYKPYTQKQ